MDAKNLDLAVALRHELHSHPELSYDEKWTKKTLMGFIAAHTRLRIVDKGRWFYAVYDSPVGERSIAFRADFDALPIAESCAVEYASKISGVSHQCGHDGHAASLAAFALEVERCGSRNNIFFLFQHAEETGQGAFECQEMFRENSIDEVFAFHIMSGFPRCEAVLISGPANFASEGLILSFTGTPSHASMPELGHNPAFAVSKLVSAIPELTDPSKYKGIVRCTVVQIDVGDRAFGTSASSGKLLLTIRGEYESEMDVLRERIIALAEELASLDALTFTFEICDYFPDTFNHEQSVEKVRAACARRGIPVGPRPLPSRGSEDFGYYTKLVPGAIFNIGAGETYPPVHSGRFDFPDDAMPVAVAVFSELAGVDNDGN